MFVLEPRSYTAEFTILREDSFKCLEIANKRYRVVGPEENSLYTLPSSTVVQRIKRSAIYGFFASCFPIVGAFGCLHNCCGGSVNMLRVCCGTQSGTRVKTAKLALRQLCCLAPREIACGLTGAAVGCIVLAPASYCCKPLTSQSPADGFTECLNVVREEEECYEETIVFETYMSSHRLSDAHKEDQLVTAIKEQNVFITKLLIKYGVYAKASQKRQKEIITLAVCKWLNEPRYHSNEALILKLIISADPARISNYIFLNDSKDFFDLLYQSAVAPAPLLKSSIMDYLPKDLAALVVDYIEFPPEADEVDSPQSQSMS